MRIGLTQMNPNKEFPLPLYALPDLVSMGPSWLYAITKTHNNVYTAQRRQEELSAAIREAQELVGEWEGSVPRPVLPPPDQPAALDGLPQGGNGGLGGDNDNVMLQEALFSYRRHPKVIQSKHQSQNML